MPLVQETLKTALLAAINAAFVAASNPENNNDASKLQYAEDVTDAIDAYVKSIRLTFPPGSIVVQGSASAQSNGSPIVIGGAID